MRPTEKEDISLGIPLLQYEDLIAPNRTWLPILTPREIPIHPTVFESATSYSQEFAERIAAAVPDSIQQDIEAIERITGKPLGVQVTNEGIVKNAELVLFEEFGIEADGQTVWVESILSATAVNMGLSRSRQDNDANIFEPYDSLPVPKVKLDKYRIPSDPEKRIIAWHTHNIGEADFATLLYLRNFAIMFNNLGLQEVVK